VSANADHPAALVLYLRRRSSGTSDDHPSRGQVVEGADAPASSVAARCVTKTDELMKVLKVSSAELLYAKGDIHPTQFAQGAIVKEIVARIAQIEGRPNIHWDEGLTLTHLHYA
jgi:hypothetical protein